MEKLIKIILTLSAATAVILAGYLGMQFLQLKKQEVANEARSGCAQSSRYQVQESKDVLVWYPIEELYQKCLKEKGF